MSAFPSAASVPRMRQGDRAHPKLGEDPPGVRGPLWNQQGALKLAMLAASGLPGTATTRPGSLSGTLRQSLEVKALSPEVLHESCMAACNCTAHRLHARTRSNAWCATHGCSPSVGGATEVMLEGSRQADVMADRAVHAGQHFRSVHRLEAQR